MGGHDVPYQYSIQYDDTIVLRSNHITILPYAATIFTYCSASACLQTASLAHNNVWSAGMAPPFAVNRHGGGWGCQSLPWAGNESAIGRLWSLVSCPLGKGLDECLDNNKENVEKRGLGRRVLEWAVY